MRVFKRCPYTLSQQMRGLATRMAPSSMKSEPRKCLAAVAWKPKEKYWENALSIEEIYVKPPGPGEVRVKIMYTTL